LKIGEGEVHFYPYKRQSVRWFADSPDTGDPACLCSLCGTVIPEEDCAIRCTNQKDNLEARFHERCFQIVDKRHFE
jgi:hypothetical protein